MMKLYLFSHRPNKNAVFLWYWSWPSIMNSNKWLETCNKTQETGPDVTQQHSICHSDTLWGEDGAALSLLVEEMPIYRHILGLFLTQGRHVFPWKDSYSFKILKFLCFLLQYSCSLVENQKGGCGVSAFAKYGMIDFPRYHLGYWCKACGSYIWLLSIQAYSVFVFLCQCKWQHNELVIF